MNVAGDNYKFMTEDFIQQLKIKFDSVKNHKNVISVNDIIIIVRELGYVADYKEINDLYSETLDNIDFIYFLVIVGRVLAIYHKEEYKKEMLDAFYLLDRDNNGSIEIDELLLLEGMGGINVAELRQIFLEIDTDHDGHITIEEYKNFLNIKG